MSHSHSHGHRHSHRHSHGHSHNHSRSRSPTHTPLGTLNRSFKMEVAPASPPKHDHHSHEPDRDHGDHDHHDHDHENHTRAQPSGMQARNRTPSPLTAVNGWKRSSTSGGKPLMTPTNASFAGHYKAPVDKAAGPAHDHFAERSRFTNLLLPHTAKWPMLHSIMTEKDSRRIFYFMRCV